MNAAHYWLPAPPAVRVFLPDLLPMEVWEAPRPSSFPSLRCRVDGRLNSRSSTTVPLRPKDGSTFSTNPAIRGRFPERCHTKYVFIRDTCRWSIHPRSTGRKRSVAVLKSFHRYADRLLSGPPRSVRRPGDQRVISLLRFRTCVPFVNKRSGRR